MDYKELNAYKMGFLNGIDTKDNFKTIIFGYEAGKLLDIIGEYEMQHEKKKMTRKEAIAAFEYHMPDVRNASRTIDFYIEAGMLEIVEEEVLVCDHVDSRPMIIKRNGKIVYDETR